MFNYLSSTLVPSALFPRTAVPAKDSDGNVLYAEDGSVQTTFAHVPASLIIDAFPGAKGDNPFSVTGMLDAVAAGSDEPMLFDLSGSWGSITAEEVLDVLGAGLRTHNVKATTIQTRRLAQPGFLVSLIGDPDAGKLAEHIGANNQARLMADPQTGELEVLGAKEVMITSDAIALATVIVNFGYEQRLEGLTGPITITGTENPHISEQVASVATTGTLVPRVATANVKQAARAATREAITARFANGVGSRPSTNPNAPVNRRRTV